MTEHFVGSEVPKESIPLVISGRPLFVAVFLAVCLWGWIFGLDWGNFWLKMAVSAAVLAGYSLWINRADLHFDYHFSWRFVGNGIMSALFLYGIFWVGGYVLPHLLPSSRELIGAVYATKSALPAWTIVFLLALVIGPAEEIFWRGLVQKRLVAVTSPQFGLILGAVLYALVHLWAKNVVLILAALICGLVWGWQYLKSGSLIGVILSHVLWDIAVFIVAPLD